MNADFTALWRIEPPRLIATLARRLRDVALAEELAQEAFVAAIEQWPRDGVPDNPGAWLMAAATHRAVDALRRKQRVERKHGEVEVIADLTRPKKTLTEAQVPFEVPRGEALAERVASVLEVLYLVFNEGYSATAGDDWLRPALCEDALRLGRVLVGLLPDEAEVHGLVALMELQASRMGARVGRGGEPVLLNDQNRSRWDRLLITRGLAALARAASLTKNERERKLLLARAATCDR